MRNSFFLVIVAVSMMLVTACSLSTAPTGDSASDPSSAQNLMPTIAGYSSVEATSITDAITAVGGSAALVTGNAAVSAAIDRIDDMIDCYEGVGAVSARIYTEQNISQVLEGELPKVGALAIINRDRAVNNLLPCALQDQGGFSAQAVTVDPCGGTGNFVVDGETIDYIYAATDPELCGLFVSALNQ